MTRFIAAASLLLASGCTLSVISGFEDGGTGSGSGGSPGVGSITSGGTTGQFTATGSGTASGGQGSTGQVSGSSGGTTGTSIGGSGGVSGSSSGGSSTGYSGDAGPCMAFGSNCITAAQCCNGACDGTCKQAFGQSCLTDPDCSSGNCMNGQCACAQSQGAQFSSCADDQDCCGGLGCEHYAAGGEQFGLCCTPTGSACPGGNECCNQNCVDGQCQCLATGSSCGNYLDDCCSGICANDLTAPAANYVCQVGPGEQCTQPSDCTTRNCDGGVCGSCTLRQGICSSASECCSGLTCAADFSVIGAPNGPIIDAGATCCGQSGTSCDSSDGTGPAFGCCGTCNNGTCACVTTTNQCENDQSCCAGGACMRRASSGSGALACCQLNGQSCLADNECCTGNCGGDQKCACVADGGACKSSSSAEGAAACCSGQCGDAGACL